MQTHVRVLGWLQIVLGVIDVLMGLAAFGFMSGIGAISGDAPPIEVRLPRGHPEGYLEAFATLYSEFARLIRSGDTACPDLPSLADAERAHIVRVLEAVNWNKKQAASVLEISRGTLYRKIVEYGLDTDPRPSRHRGRRAEG